MAKTSLAASLLFSAVMFATPASAVDGVVLINHTNALAGNVTPGDTPGYPVTISQPGSYRLSGNLTVPAGINGINAAAPEVTIDFNGFRMQGAPKAAFGIFGTQRSLTVHGGTIRGFDESAISAGSGAIIEDMRISANRFGVSVLGDRARIINNTIIDNLGTGISCAVSCHIEGNYIGDNATGVAFPGNPFGVGVGTVLGNTIMGNGVGISKFLLAYVGFGNNSILNNTTSLSGGVFTPLHPNFCFPVNC